MATTWVRQEHSGTWLLDDLTTWSGTVAYEKTSGGRKVRRIGSATSTEHYNWDDIVGETLQRTMRRKGRKALTRFFDDSAAASKAHASQVLGTTASARFDVTVPAVDATLLHPDDPKLTTVGWEFVSADHPHLTAWLWLTWSASAGGVWTVRRSLTYFAVKGVDSDGTLAYGRPAQNVKSLSQDEVVDNGFDIGGVTLGAVKCESAVRAAAEVLKALRAITAQQTITVPMSDQAVPMRLNRTNFNGRLYQDLTDFVNVAPTLDRIRTTYERLLADLAAVGFVVSKTPRKNSLLRAVQEKSLYGLSCVVIPLTDDDGETPTGVADDTHEVAIDLATGTMTVACKHSVDKDEVAEAWEFSRTKADLLGQLDEFNAFVKNEQKKRDRARHARIVRARTVSDQ